MIEEQIPQEPQETIKKTEELKGKQKNSRPNWRVWVAAGGCTVFLCAAAFIGALIYMGPQIAQKFIPNNLKAAKGLPRRVTNINTMGDPNAPIQIIEYGDFQCPYCLKFWSESEPQLIDEYVNTGKVYFEFKSVGAFIGQESDWAAQGAYCAGDQNKFWEYHDALFANWTGENAGDFTKDNLIKYAKKLNLDMTEFESCINTEKHKGTVEQDAADAKANGVRATPTLFINGVKFEGAEPYSVLKDFIDQALKGNLNKQSG